MAKKPEPYKPRGGGKLGDPIMYNKGKQWADQAATDAYYNSKQKAESDKLEAMGGSNPFDMRFRGKTDKNGNTAVDLQEQKVHRMGQTLAGRKAYQKQWIAKGAMANEAALKAKALKDAATKRKNK